MQKYMPHKPMTQKELSYYGKDGRLKIIRQWIFEGKSYSARRDSLGYIEIVDDENYYDVSAGRRFCFSENDIDKLARELGVM